MLHDFEAKQRLGYKERLTKVFYDGREVLKGRDWQKRVRELKTRDRQKCQIARLVPGRKCSNKGTDPHHVRARSDSRDDRLENLILLCRECHRFIDPRKPQWTAPQDR